MIRFGTNPDLAIQNIDQLAASLLTGKELPGAMDEFGQEAAKHVVTNLKNFSTRDPSITEHKGSPPFPAGGITGKIADNIEHSVRKSIRSTNVVLGGIGNIAFLDANDPLRELNSPRRLIKEGQAIWRFLEFGVNPHVIAARTKPYLNFYFKRLKKRIKTKSINHPGFAGRAYWETAKFDIGREFQVIIPAAISKVIKRYSKR